jgi:DNA segregation ATPase FtsK/SpoIIIE-like protein
VQTAPGTPKPPSANASPDAHDIAPHAPARTALRELVDLCAQCAAREAEIEQAHRAALDQAERELSRSKSNTELRFKSVREEVAAKSQQRVGEITAQFDAEVQQLKELDHGKRQQVLEEYDRATGDVNGKMQQATWLAESVFEGAQNGIRADSKKAKELLSTQLAWVDETEKKADALIARYRQAPPGYVPAEEPRPPDVAPDQAFNAAKAQMEQHLSELRHLSLPRLFAGVKPFLIVPLIAAITAVITNWAMIGHPMSQADLHALRWEPKYIASGALGALLFCAALGAMLWALGKSQVRGIYLSLRRTGMSARAAARIAADEAAEEREAARSRAIKKRNIELETIKRQYSPHLQRALRNRDSALQTLQIDFDKRMQRLESIRDRALAEAGAWQKQNVDSLEHKYGAELQSADQRSAGIAQEGERTLEQQSADLRQRWADGLRRIEAPLAQQSKSAGSPRLLHWDDPAWKTWIPPKTFNPTIRFGELRVDLKQITDQYPRTLQLPASFAVPATLTLPRHASLMVHFNNVPGRQQAIATIQTTMVRLLTSLPAGRVRFTLIDPVGLGQNFAGFMHLADHDDALVGGRIWTSAEHIDQRLADLTEHMETVIQKYLRNEFATIDDYNAQAGELAEPYRFLVVADLPTNFSSESLRRLASIASTGARCGVYTLITRDLRQPIPGGDAHLEEIESHSLNLAQQKDGAFVWNDDVFRRFPLVLDAPPSEDFLTRIMDLVGRGAKEAKRVEVPFSTIAPKPEKMWTGGTANELTVPVGRAGATRLQSLKLGRGVAQHALIAGKTGSGKSTLLHAMVTNTAMWYSPDEVEFYLVDFKKGVEFKTYASNELPHARAIAVESDREFGLSVLQRLDAELARRGELFRNAGVQDLAAYRQTTKQSMPRTLLIIDEFQEFFSEDDKLAQDAAVLIDRLVRQGRAFGIHVLLGSQTIGGTSGLSRSTLGQMAIRIALQTSEADSQLILGDNNSAARLLTRPGEAIYNDAGGLVEGNSPFQVAWLPDEQRDQYLRSVLEKFRHNGGAAATRREPAIVFEGNAPADITKNRRLLAALAAKEMSNQPPKAWLGDPVAIKDPTAVTFRRQAGANVLIIGQHEEAAMALMASSITSLAAQAPAATFVVLDGAPANSPLAKIFPRVRDAVSNEVKLIEYRAAEEAINELAGELSHRQSGGGANPPPIYLLIYGLQRYRGLRKQEDSFSFGSGGDEEKKPQADKQFAELLRDGPSAGIHTVAWCDTAAALERTLDRQAVREFDNRVLFQMSSADSSNLIDSPLGNKLGPNRALLYSEEQGVSEKFRPYALPDERWLTHVRQQLASRKAN